MHEMHEPEMPVPKRWKVVSPGTPMGWEGQLDVLADQGAAFSSNEVISNTERDCYAATREPDVGMFAHAYAGRCLRAGAANHVIPVP